MRSRHFRSLSSLLLLAPATAFAQQAPAPLSGPPAAQPTPLPQPQTPPATAPPAVQATPSADNVGPTGPGVAHVPTVIVKEPPAAVKKAETAKPRVRTNVSKSEGPSAGPKAAAAQPAIAPVISPEAAAQAAIAAQTQAFDAARTTFNPSLGASTYTLPREAITSLPQGDNTPLDKILLQTPGVAQDSAASGDLHVRNEHANVQYRVNGILLPDGVSGFGSFLDANFVGSLSLVTGALPAQYGLHTAGIVDIQTRTGGIEPGGSVGLYAGSHGTRQPSFEYGGQTGSTQYFFASRGNWNSLGIENTTSRPEAIHDYTEQGKAFGYTSTIIDAQTRIVSIAGVSIQHYQVPNTPGQTTGFTVNGISDFDSTRVDERQIERNVFGVLAWQKKTADTDIQVAAFTRSSNVHFGPDRLGDLLFNGIASDVNRTSVLNGVQADAALRVNSAHTLRGGIIASVERTSVTNDDLVLPASGSGAAFGILDQTSKTGYIFGAYFQDEWKLTDKLTLNAGLRFDQMVSYVTANQVSPRVSLAYKPFDGTTLHAGYARYFTPPPQVEGASANIALFNGSSAASAVQQADPVLPERSHYFDTGIAQKFGSAFEIGVDGYYKLARDLLDDGQFGQAYVLQAFNYDRARNYGVEVSAKYEKDGLRLYGNVAWAEQLATRVVSNQYLFDPDELAYIANHDINTDHAQTWTGSAGGSYLFDGTRYSADLIVGSGLRNGFANTTHLPAYYQVNLGLSHEFKDGANGKPLTLRFDVINLFDTGYELRDGSGIGVFAPQYGPRRAFYAGVSQKF